MNKQEPPSKKSQPMQNLMQSRNRGYDSQGAPRDDPNPSFCGAEFETDPSLLIKSGIIDSKGVGNHLIQIDNNDAEMQAFKSCLSKQTENRFLGTDEKTISLYAQDFDLSNTI